MMRTTGLPRKLSEMIESVRCAEGLMGRIRLFTVFLLVLPLLLHSTDKRGSRIMVIYHNILNSICVGLIVNVRGVRYVLNDYENLLVLPFYGSWIWDYLNPQNGDVCIDVGSHVGKYTLQIAKIVGEQGLVVAIDPNPMNCATLNENIALNNFSNVIVVEAAAWHCNTKLKFSFSGSSLDSSVKFDFGLDSIEVEARELDDILQELDVDRVDWVKINVEGAELETLKGLIDALVTYRPMVIAEVERSHSEELAEFLSTAGYTMRIIHTAQNGDLLFYLLTPDDFIS